MNGKIVNCDFAFKCPQQWEKMGATGIAGVRFCGECKKDVHLCVAMYGDQNYFNLIVNNCSPLPLP